MDVIEGKGEGRQANKQNVIQSEKSQKKKQINISHTTHTHRQRGSPSTESCPFLFTQWLR